MKVNLPNYKNNNRKIKVQVQYWDTWNVDHTLALIILPLLLQLKDTKHGIPNTFVHPGGNGLSDQLEFDFYTESADESLEAGVKLWEETLDKMIWSFQQLALEEYDSLYHHGARTGMLWEISADKFTNPVTGKQESLYQLKDQVPDSHWYDHVGHLLHETRIQEGLDLFGQYYRSLWD